MKKLTFIAIMLALSLAACTVQGSGKARTKNLQLTSIYLESGNIENGTFQNEPSMIFKSGGFFKPEHRAIGAVSTNSSCKPNGYQDNQGYLYVFEGGGIPTEMQDIQKASTAIKNAVWVETPGYELPYDALICQRKPIFTFRPAGKIPRFETEVSGIKIYKIKNEVIVEDYTQFLDYHKTANRNIGDAVDLINTLKLNAADYQINSSRSGLVITNGKIDRERSSETAFNTMDKITFSSQKANLPTYQLRVFLIKKTIPELDNLYEIREGKKVLKDGIEETFFNVIKQNYLRSFRVDMIQNYDCDPCFKIQQSGQKSSLKTLKIQDEKNPPLPLIEG